MPCKRCRSISSDFHNGTKNVPGIDFIFGCAAFFLLCHFYQTSLLTQ
nr:MAG TPA: hypothetical protein [Caudoviricetes sp.]